jgi:hypothetical protein
MKAHDHGKKGSGQHNSPTAPLVTNYKGKPIILAIGVAMG